MAQASGRMPERNTLPEDSKLRTSTKTHAPLEQPPEQSTRRATPIVSSPAARAESDLQGGQDEDMSLARVAWLVTVVAFVIAALLLLVNGYLGYFLVLLSVAFAAAVNLLR